MFLQVLLITIFIELVIAGITSLIFYAAFNYVFVDPIISFKEKLKRKTLQFIDSNFILKKAFEILKP